MIPSYCAERYSGWFRRSRKALAGRPDGSLEQLAGLIAAPLTAATIDAAWQARLAREEPPEIALRRFRTLLMLAMIERDVTQTAPLEEILTAITTWAERAIAHAMAVAARELSDDGQRLVDDEGRPEDLLVVGMGKLGGAELNVSSDVDLVFVVRDPGPQPQLAEKIVRRVTTLLAQMTGDGHVFRVDTRLRPYGDAGPPVASFSMLEQYFFEQGREWERFAWLKARVIASSGLAPKADTLADEQALMQRVTPFVFRRYLDYAAFSALSKLHDMIRTEARKVAFRRSRSGNAGFDVKLGRGGIREIEFCAQLFQIVRGGQDPVLRERSTPEALARLAQRRLLETATVDALTSAWRLLRRTEHALQYLEDEQTHWLSDAPAKRATVAAMLGLEQSTFDARLSEARDSVVEVFDKLLAPARRQPVRTDRDSDTGSNPDSSSNPDTGSDPDTDEESRRRLDALRESRRYRLASDATRSCIERLLASALARTPPIHSSAVLPATRIARLCDFLEAIAGRPAYLALLDDHPAAFNHLLGIMAQAQWAATYLLRHPIVLDELLDGQLLEPFDCARWGRELREQLAATTLAGRDLGSSDSAPDVERQMDAMREAHHAAVFRLLAQDLDGRLSVEAIGDLLSALADGLLEIVVELIWSQLPRRHCAVPRFAVIAYGKLGGKELGYASDLDLVFLHDDDHDDAQQNYSQLAQRMANWLSIRTGAGLLFEVDLRLRPNGGSGLLVSSISAFERYQAESAWVWEHQALTRARFAAGDATIGSRFESMRRDILARPRQRSELGESILEMRRKMHEGHPNRSALFDLKHDFGGMVDIEFMVQYLVLAWAPQYPELLDNRGNIELLRRAGLAGLLEPHRAQALGDIYRHYRQLQHELRLNEIAFARVALDRIEREVHQVRQAWQDLFGPSTI